MDEFVLFLFWLVIATLAAVGAVVTWEWLTSDGRRRELAEEERQAELEIQSISYQAQMAMLDEALRRSRPGSPQPPRPDVIDGEVVSSNEDPKQPS